MFCRLLLLAALFSLVGNASGAVATITPSVAHVKKVSREHSISNFPAAAKNIPSATNEKSISNRNGGVQEVVEATLEFALFDGIKLKDPSPKELQVLLDLTSEFSTSLLEGTFPGLESVEAVLDGSCFNADSPFPIQIDYDLITTFQEDVAVPSQDNLVAAMDGLDYADYIVSYAWEVVGTIPNSIFFETQMVQFNERLAQCSAGNPSTDTSTPTESPTIGMGTTAPTTDLGTTTPTVTAAPTDTTTPTESSTIDMETTAPTTDLGTTTPTVTAVPTDTTTPTESPTIDMGTTAPTTDLGTTTPTPTTIDGDGLQETIEASMEFSFFDNIKLKKPSPKELKVLIDLTSVFYTKSLEGEFPGLASVEAVLDGSCFDKDSPLPFQIDLGLITTFQEDATVPSQADLVAAMDGLDYADYIVSYVWEVVGTVPNSIFFETQMVQFNERLAQCSVGIPSTDTTPPTASPTMLMEPSGNDFDTTSPTGTAGMIGTGIGTRSPEASGTTVTGTATRPPTNTNQTVLEVELTFRFEFKEEKGATLDTNALNVLTANTIDFYQEAFLSEPAFKDIFVDLILEDVGSVYSKDNPGELEVTLIAQVKILELTSVKNRQAGLVFSGANIDKYLQRLKHNKSGHRSAFYEVNRVHVKAVTTENGRDE